MHAKLSIRFTLGGCLLINQMSTMTSPEHSELGACERNKLEWLINRILLLSLSVHVTYEMYTKLEWIVNCILSFSQSVHVTYETYTDYHPVLSSFQLTHQSIYSIMACIEKSVVVGN